MAALLQWVVHVKTIYTHPKINSKQKDLKEESPEESSLNHHHFSDSHPSMYESLMRLSGSADLFHFIPKEN